MKLYKYTDGRANASGQKIKERREAAGLSQEELAAQLQLAGLNQCHLDKGERNVRHFPQRANGQRKMEMPGRIRDIFHQASLRME